MGGRSRRRTKRSAGRAEMWPKRSRSAVLLGLFLLVLGLCLLLVPFLRGGDTWRGLSGEGRSGIFVAEEYECGRHSCNWHGTFTSTDGQIIKTDVSLASVPDGVVAGSETPVLDVAEDSRVVYVAGAPWPFLSMLLFVAFCGGVVAFGLHCVLPWRWLPARLRRWALD